jgi:hypothetical protein
LAGLTVRSRSKTLDQPSGPGNDQSVVQELFERFLTIDLDLRRVGVKVSGFVREEVAQKQLTSFVSVTSVFRHFANLIIFILTA